MNQVGWAVISAGGIARRRTIPEGIAAASNARLVAVHSRDAARAREIADEFGAEPYTEINRMLVRDDVDAVYIASPNYLHLEHVLAAARAKKHVLCEKPLAMSTGEARSLVRACEDAGVKLGVGFMMRFNVYHQELKRILQARELGDIVFARAQLSCWYPPMEGAWRQDPALGGGGALMDLTVHCVDLLEMLLGDVVEVAAMIGTRVHNYKSDDTNALLLRFASGTFGFIDCAFNIPDCASENILEIQGSKGCAKARMTIGQGPAGELLVCRDGGSEGYDAQQQRDSGSYCRIELEPANTYRAEIEGFSNAILNGTPPPVGGAAGLRSLLVVEAALKSSQTRCFEHI